MSRASRIFKRFLGAGKPDAVEALRARVASFRDLLEANSRVLELIADAGGKLGGEYLFDIQYLRWLDAELAAAVERVVEDLAAIDDERHPALREALERTRAEVRAALESRAASCDGPLCIPRDDLGTERARQAGEKMARLGELHAHLGLRTPVGFVITTCAYQQLAASPEIAPLLDELATGPPDPLAAAERVSRAVASAKLPRSVARAIRRSTRRLGRSALLAVRSSAVGEDGELSFAGLHRTILGVPRRDVPAAYLRVVASLFDERPVRYRLEHGQPLGRSAMAVGCVEMVPATASGVVFTMDPADPERDVLIVSAILGLGVGAVEGTAAVDRFVVSRGDPHEVRERTIATKQKMQVVAPGGGVELVDVPPAMRDAPCIDDASLAELARLARRIERHMKCPQDIEWAMDAEGRLTILQARPLRVAPAREPRAADLAAAVAGRPILMKGLGEVACRGIGAGKVCVVGPEGKAADFPPGGVLVARYASPALSSLVAGAAAVITDVGAPTGHLATIAREYRVPTIVGTGDATRLLRPGSEVTVDAEEGIVYEGCVDELLRYGLLSGHAFEEMAEFRILRAMLRSVAPLRLLDPGSPEFRAERCATYHDIIRFAHEKALTEISETDALDLGGRDKHLQRVSLDIPLGLRLIDVGGGLAPGREGSGEVTLGDLACAPLRPLLEGLVAPGTWTTTPTDMDLAGFMSSATRSGALSVPGSARVQHNLAIVSDAYLNLSLRLGYHFNVVDACLGEGAGQSYISFRFVGGVTDLSRRTRRARLLSEILTHYDFVVSQRGDFVVGRLTGAPWEMVEDRLRMIGRLIGFARQLDILLRDDATVLEMVDGFVHGGRSPRGMGTKRGMKMGDKIEVMVLDDEPTVCERLRDHLVKKGMAVETFVDSASAIARLGEKQFDVVVTDLKMRGPTGIDVLVHVRHEELPTEVIIITGFANMEDARAAEFVGAFDFLNKPFRLDDIHALVKKAAKKARRRAH